MSSDLTFAVIGLGNIGQEHVKSLSAGLVHHARVVAAASRTAPAPNLLPEGVNHYQDHRQLLETEKPDVVIVATPTLTHKSIALDVLAAGCHLLVEKPAGMTVLEADALKAVPLKPGQLFGVVLNQRYDPFYRQIKSCLQDKLLGEIQRISWTLTHWYRPEIYFKVSDWRGTWRGEGGGLLLNQCIHNLDIFYWLFGMPQKIYGECQFGKYHDIEVEDEVTAILQFDNGARATFIASSGEAPGVNQLDVVGERGMLRFDGKRLTHIALQESVRAHSKSTTHMFSMPDSQTKEIPVNPGGNQHVALMQDFVTAIREKQPVATSLEEAAKSIELADGILLSAWEKKQIALPVDRDRFAQHFNERLLRSSLREKESLDVNIDMSQSYR